jgi:two-component system NtrC family sensor kinase
MEGLRKDGSEFPLELSLAQWETEEGRFYTGILHDISERRRLQGQLAQSEKLAAMAQLLAGVAHELNNPLSVVLGQAALLTRAVEGTPLAERAHKIVAAAERCGRIVGNFLALARQRPPERRSVRLNDLVQGVVEMLGYQLRVDSLEVTMELARELPGLWADPHQLQQVMINLVTNAQHAMRGTPEPRRLRITTRHDGESVVLELADSGPGIPADVRTRLFEPFFTTKPPGEGTGLGLSLCRGIVAEHGGTIGFECPPEGGTLFRVALPLAQPREPAASGSPASPIAPQPRQRRILVVDDEVEVAEVAADFLRELGHEADVAPSGAVALAELARQRYELVLSDMKMPHMDGPAFFREATRLFPYLAGRFVFLTGDNLSQDVASFLERSGAPGIAKPFQMEDLADVVAKLLID